MPAKRMPLPKKIVFPFGYVVSVLQVPDSQMLTISEEDEKDQVCDGLWLVDILTIYIRKSLSITRKRYVLLHESQHALNDIMHALLNSGKAKA